MRAGLLARVRARPAPRGPLGPAGGADSTEIRLLPRPEPVSFLTIGAEGAPAHTPVRGEGPKFCLGRDAARSHLLTQSKPGATRGRRATEPPAHRPRARRAARSRRCAPGLDPRPILSAAERRCPMKAKAFRRIDARRTVRAKSSRKDRARAEEQARLRVLTEQMPAVIWSTDVDFRITSSLGAGLGGMNRRPGEAVGRSLLEYLDTQDPGFPPLAAHRRALQGESVNYDLEWGGRTFQAHVEPLRDGEGGISGTIGVALDITERKQAEDRLLHAVLHDALTGLPNRALFLDRLAHALDRTRRKGQPFGALLLDLDRFKHVNDGLGHLAGDRLLVAVAQRLRACVRPQDTVARFGGDEFTVLLEDIDGAADAVRVAERIRYDLSPPVEVDGHEVVTGASVGIAVSAPSYRRPEEVLRDAETAMYRAKARGGPCCQGFEGAMHERAVWLLRLWM